MEHIQATNIVIEDKTGPITISALYTPPKHKVKCDAYADFFSTLGPRFLVGGDFNAKHTDWGARTSSTKGRELAKAVQKLRLQVVSTGEPTYWPTSLKKRPDLVDFCVIKGLPMSSISCKSSYDLSSDHTPVLVALDSKIFEKEIPCKLHTHKTDWKLFQKLVDTNLDSQIPLKTEDDIILAVEKFTKVVQEAAWNATPPSCSVNIVTSSKLINEMVQQKRQARKKWQQTKHPRDKTILNKLTTKLKKVLAADKNHSVSHYLQNLGATPATNYSLWKATKKLKRPTTHQHPLRRDDNTWAKSDAEKAEEFAKHLGTVFMPNPDTGSSKSTTVSELLNQANQLDLPIANFSKSEVKHAIDKLKLNKAPGYDLITAKIMKELPISAQTYITYLYNAMLRREFVPSQWKVAEIIMILKPGKKPDESKSYRPISLLPVASKILEHLFLRRLMAKISESNLIPDHQFGFRRGHGTIEQVHRLVEKMNFAFENKKFCSAAFLDISQAFDRVWHEGLLYKIKTALPVNYFMFLQSYLSNRYFFVRHGNDKTSLREIHAGVPQGSVLGPVLYLIYTADLPLSDDVLTGTFADDTSILAVHSDAAEASAMLQNSLNNISTWLKDWRIKANESKSVHVTFTTRRDTCPSVSLNGIQIPQEDHVRYLGVYLDRRLTWQKHIFTKRIALSLQLRTMHWLINRKSQLSLENKLLIYKCIMKPVWAYGIQLWGTASNSNLEILQRFQSKMLRMIAGAPWYITNNQLHHDLEMPTVKEEIQNFMKAYKTRISNHTNHLASALMTSDSGFKRLKRKAPQDLLP